MGDCVAECVHELVLDEPLFDRRAFATVVEGVGDASAENPVQGRDVRLLENIKIATDDCRLRWISLKPCAFKLFQSPLWMCEDEVETNHVERCPRDRDVDIEPAAIANFRKKLR